MPNADSVGSRPGRPAAPRADASRPSHAAVPDRPSVSAPSDGAGTHGTQPRSPWSVTATPIRVRRSPTGSAVQLLSGCRAASPRTRATTAMPAPPGSGCPYRAAGGTRKVPADRAAAAIVPTAQCAAHWPARARALLSRLMPARNPHREVRQCRDAERTPHGNGAGRQRDANGVDDLQGRSRAWRSASIASPTAFASRKCSPSGCVGRPRDRAGRPAGPSA